MNILTGLKPGENLHQEFLGKAVPTDKSLLNRTGENRHSCGCALRTYMRLSVP